MAKTIEQLKAQGAQVKNATVVGENTATRVGTLFTDILEHVEQYEAGQTADTKANTLAINQEAQARAKADEQLNTAIEAEKNRAEAAEKAIIFDVSAHNDGAVFESIQALLSSSNLGTLIPTSVRRGGMTIRFIRGSEQSSDNKYVQYRLMSTAWSTNVSNWQGVDDELTAGSDNLVKSGGVYNSLEKITGFEVILNVLPILYFKKCIDPKDGSISDTSYSAYLSDLIDIHTYKKIRLESTKDMETVWGWRILSSDGETVISYGACPAAKAFNLYIPTSGYYFQFSNLNTIYNNCSLIAPVNKSIGELISEINEVKGFSTSDIFNPSEKLSSTQYIDPRSGNVINTGYAAALSNLLDIHQYKYLQLACSVNMEDVWGWRFLASDGETVVYYGRATKDTHIEFKVPVNAYYFQFSQLGTIYNNCSLKVPVSSSIGDLIDTIQYFNDVKDSNLNFNVFEPDVDLLPEKQWINPSKGGNIEKTGYDIYTTKPLILSERFAKVPKSLFLIDAADPNNNVGYRFLDSSDNVITFGYNNSNNCAQEINIPENAYSFQVSIHADTGKLLSAIIGGIIPNEKEIRLLKKEVKNIKNLSNSIPYATENAGGAVSIAANETKQLIKENFVNNEWVLGCSIELNGEMDGTVEIQKGLTNYGISKVVITPTKIIEYYMPTSSCTKEYEHGLILENTFSVMIKFDIVPIIKLMTKSGIFEQELLYFDGSDGMQITNTNSHSILVQNANIDVTLGLVRKVLVFGDSYAHEKWGIVHSKDFNYSWTTILKEFGAYFSNVGYPGGTPDSNLNKYIAMGSAAKIIIWGKGYNNGADTDIDTPDATWLASLNSAIALAESIGAILIPCTIPTTPRKYHGAKSKYIREHFERYVDFDYILTDNSSTWKTGYLSSDNVHPSALGFEAMAIQAVKDVPELFNK